MSRQIVKGKDCGCSGGKQVQIEKKIKKVSVDRHIKAKDCGCSGGKEVSIDRHIKAKDCGCGGKEISHIEHY